MLLKFQVFISGILQSLKSVKSLSKLTAQVKKDLQYIEELPKNTQSKQGTLIVKCDDIGDFLVWQQVIPTIVEKAERPIVFVGNAAIKSLYQEYFDFADEVIWIKKQQWSDVNYRQQIYQKVNGLKVSTALTTLFTRNLIMDDLVVKAANARQSYAWSIKHHAYFPKFELTDTLFTHPIKSIDKVKLEYFRNIEFINLIFKSELPYTLKPLFPNFNKYNTLIVVPVASAGSKTWSKEYFASAIQQVLSDFDKCILIAGSNGVEAAEYITHTVNSPKIINLVNQTKLHEAFAFIGEARALLTLDTFTSHVGVLTKTDTVLVSNGTNWQRFADYAPYVESNFISLMPEHISLDHQKVKTKYSSSEIQSIKVSQVVNALKSLKH